MDDADLIETWRAEEREQPEGWDFSSLTGRLTETAEPWDLDALWRSALADAKHVLDMGTGGGEFLARFTDVLPADTVATEGWAPNVPVAARNLAAHGVQVVEYGAPDDDVDSVTMPFDDDRFDRVLNRHESFSPRELARVLAPGGVFLTQQVGGDECGELDELFPGGRHTLPHINHAAVVRELTQAGFDVTDGAEHVGYYEFVDVAALLAYWQLVPWEVPENFTVDRYREQLLLLHRSCGGGPVRLTRKRFWIRAVRR